MAFWLLLSCLTLSAQSISEIKSDPDQYIWGEGVGPTMKKADDEALQMLISQISTRVESSFEMIQTESGKDYKDKVQSIIRTYSSATLKNAKRIPESDEPEAKVFRYMKRSEIASIFEERKGKILSFVNYGNNALNKYQVSDALKYYYWALILLRSHPDGAKILALDGSLMSVWLTDQINATFNNLSADVVNLVKDNGFTIAVLNVAYNKTPVSNYDFSYWDGKEWSGICSAKDGLASAELVGNLREVKTLKLKSEYIFGNEANFDNELKEVLQSFEPIPFRNHVITAKFNYKPMTATETVQTQSIMHAEQAPPVKQALPLQTPPQADPTQAPLQTVQAQTNQAQTIQAQTTQPTMQAPASSQSNPAQISLPAAPSQTSPLIAQKSTQVQTQSIEKFSSGKEVLIAEVTDKTNYENSVSEIKKAISSGRYYDVKPLFTPEGFDFFQKLVQYGNAKVLRNQPLKYVQKGKEVLCRSIPMSFSFKNNNKQFVEELVLRFDSTQKINELTFALGQKAVSDIMSKTIWSENVRMQIIDFMESYKTAYALKRLDYIQKIFSDDALIIIGTYINVKGGEPNPYRNNRVLKYNRLNKQEYIKNLQQAFGSNEFINLKFEDNEVRKSGKGGEVYGIQIKQNFNSPSYSDLGYLFLMMDFNNPSAPIIHVRTWQPEKNRDGSIYGLNDFN